MSKIYAIPGNASMTVIADGVNYTPQDGEILMTSERPEGDYVAASDGTWVKDYSRMINDLDNQYDTGKTTLANEYAAAMLTDNTELVEELKTEYAALNDEYDAAYAEITEE